MTNSLSSQPKTQQNHCHDFVIIGAGIVGLSVAREIKKRHPSAKVMCVEKEAAPGLHASGRNSGVLHAGFYYTGESLKARLTAQGNRELKDYCSKKNILVNPCGKLVVPLCKEDVAQLDVLLKRARVNGVELKEVDKNEALHLEPRVRFFGDRALFSPTTASANPKEVISHLLNDAKEEGITIRFSTPILRVEDLGNQFKLLTGPDSIHAVHVVNAAGLYADQLAHQFGFGLNYQILPFKGLYLYSNEPAGRFKTHIYPVPNLAQPFLGVHFTLTSDGFAKIGPTAIPALWREQYGGWSRFSLAELAAICFRSFGLFFRAGFEFRKLAVQELQKYSKAKMVALASQMASGIELNQFQKWGPAGIRAQLLDTTTRKLEMDFVIEGDQRSTHILNAVSPGWTCALPFARLIVDRMESPQTLLPRNDSNAARLEV